MQDEIKVVVAGKCISIFTNVCNSREDQLWDISYLSWGTWTHFFLPLLPILPRSTSQKGWQPQIGSSGSAVYAFLFSGVKCRKQVIPQHAVGKRQRTGAAWCRFILLAKPSRYFKVKLCNHRELNEKFTVPRVNLEKPIRAESFMVLDCFLGWGGESRQDPVSCWKQKARNRNTSKELDVQCMAISNHSCMNKFSKYFEEIWTTSYCVI